MGVPFLTRVCGCLICTILALVQCSVDQTGNPRRNAWLWGLLIATLLGGAIRLTVAVQRPVWADELLTWRDATESSPRDFLLWRHNDEHTPLSYMLVSVSLEVLGEHNRWALRLPALIAGIACIPAAFLLGRVVHSHATGFAASAFVAVDLNMIDQSVQARMYTLLALLTLLSLTFAVSLYARPERRAAGWCGLGVALAGAVWANYAGLFVVAGLLLAATSLLAADVLKRNSRHRSAKRLIGLGLSLLIVVVLCLPGLIKAIGMPSESDPNVTIELPHVLNGLYRLVKQLIDLKVVTYLVLALAMVGLIGVWKRAPAAAAVLVGVLLITLILQIPARSMHRFLATRYLTTMQPAIWIGLAFLPAMINRQRLRRVTLGALTCFVLFQGWRGLNMDSDWRREPSRYAFDAAMAYVAVHRESDEALLLAPHRKVARLANFNQLPISVELSERLGRAVLDASLDAGGILDDLDADATWILARTDKPERGWGDEVRATIEATMRQYGVDINVESLDRQLSARFVLVVRIDAQGIEFWTPSNVRGD